MLNCEDLQTWTKKTHFSIDSNLLRIYNLNISNHIKRSASLINPDPLELPPLISLYPQMDNKDLDTNKLNNNGRASKTQNKLETNKSNPNQSRPYGAGSSLRGLANTS